MGPQRYHLVNSSEAMRDGPINIGMSAPAKIVIKNIDFNHNESQHLFGNHNGPMMALQ